MVLNLEHNFKRDIDFSDEGQRRAFVSQINNLRGPFKVQVQRVTRRRSNEQNAYLWAVVYPTVAAGLHEAWGETLTVDEVHVLMKQMFLSRPVVNRMTGEIAGYLYPSSAKLDVTGFSTYLEQIFKFAGEMLGCVIPAATGSY